MTGKVLQNLRLGRLVPLFLVLYLASLGGEVAHFALVDHEFSTECSEFVHSHSHENDEKEGSDSTNNHSDGTPCSTAANLRLRSNSQISRPVPIFVSLPSSVAIEIESDWSTPRALLELYRLAPKNSPPLA